MSKNATWRTRRATYRAPSGLTLTQAVTIWAGTITACIAAILASLWLTGRIG